MKTFKTFADCWAEIQKHLRAGMPLKSWSAAGHADSAFTVLKVEPGTITIDPAKGRPRRISKGDFESVFRVWADYKSENIRRHELSFSQNSTYVITILHWIETRGDLG